MSSEINMKEVKEVKIRISPSMVLRYFEKLKTNHNICLSHFHFILLAYQLALDRVSYLSSSLFRKIRKKKIIQLLHHVHPPTNPTFK